MSKPKHPCIKTIKQGQTVYIIEFDHWIRRYSIGKYFILSSKSDHNMSDGGHVIKVVDLINWAKGYPLKFIKVVFYSRKRAESRLSQYNQ